MSDPIDLDGVTKAAASHVRDTIASHGERWNRTGRLRESIKAEGDQVVCTAGDRLGDDDIAQRFADECLTDPTDERAFVAALDEAVTDALTDALGGSK